MGNIKIIRGVFDTKLELQHAGVKAGFPSPAEDYIHETLDFNRDYIRHLPDAKIAVFSSNYELYGELTGRVVSIISKETPAYFRYSIDECFMYLDRINRMNGSETVVIGAQQYTRKDGNGKAAIEREKSRACSNSSEREQARPKVKADVFANAIKHDFKSKNPTTRWADVIKLH